MCACVCLRTVHSIGGLHRRAVQRGVIEDGEEGTLLLCFVNAGEIDGAKGRLGVCVNVCVCVCPWRPLACVTDCILGAPCDWMHVPQVASVLPLLVDMCVDYALLTTVQLEGWEEEPSRYVDEGALAMLTAGSADARKDLGLR